MRISDWSSDVCSSDLRTAIKDLTPADLQSRVKDSNLRGRGGAGFPTGVKWGLVPMGPDAGAKYLVCNADEMEPGTFKDRLLLEGAPHQLVEALIVAEIGRATGRERGCTKGWISGGAGCIN